MTTNLEKQFFETFGIEPETVFRWCDYDNKLCECGYDCDEGCRSEKIGYPQITDRILLELICILRTSDALLPIFCSKNIEELKLEILSDIIKIQSRVDVKPQVQELFKEG